MMRRFSFIFSVISILLCQQVSYGLPAPLSQDELEKQSDIILKAKVLGTTYIKEGHYLQNTELPKVRIYQAWLQILDIQKGNLQRNQTLIVQWRSKPQSFKDGHFLLGPWAVNYIPGQIIKTHLKLDKNSGYYDTISWNAAQVIKKSKKNLPVNIGDTVFE